MRRTSGRWIAVLVMLTGTLATGAAEAAEIRVLSAGAVRTIVTELAEAFKKETGHTVTLTFGTVGQMRQKLASGEPTDVVIMTDVAIDQAAGPGGVVPGSRTDLARTGMGIGVRDGAPRPDISTPEGLRQTLLAAKSITYVDPAQGATSGIHFASVLQRLGIADAVKPKTKLVSGGFPAELVARGEVELVAHQISEIVPVKGVTMVGPLPRELQKVTVYSAGVAAKAAQPERARAFIAFLARAAFKPTFAAAGLDYRGSRVSILVDLDPASVERTVIVESIAAGPDRRLYLADRVTGNVLRVDPRSPQPVVVGRIESRQIDGKKVDPAPSGLAFNSRGDLMIAVGPFKEIARIKAGDLSPDRPGRADTHATGVEGANGIVFDRRDHLYVSGGRSGSLYRVSPQGGAAEVVVKIEPHTRMLPDGKTQQSIVANGLALDAKGALHVADTARGAIWRVEIGADGKAGKPTLLVQDARLHGADGIAFDRAGKLWVTANELNAIVTVAADGTVEEIAKNDSRGPLEFPSAIAFIADTAYVSNFDTPRRDNLAADGTTARDGIGASIAQIGP